MKEAGDQSTDEPAVPENNDRESPPGDLVPERGGTCSTSCSTGTLVEGECRDSHRAAAAPAWCVAAGESAEPRDECVLVQTSGQRGASSVDDGLGRPSPWASGAASGKVRQLPKPPPGASPTVPLASTPLTPDSHVAFTCTGLEARLSLRAKDSEEAPCELLPDLEAEGDDAVGCGDLQSESPTLVGLAAPELAPSDDVIETSNPFGALLSLVEEPSGYQDDDYALGNQRRPAPPSMGVSHGGSSGSRTDSVEEGWSVPPPRSSRGVREAGSTIAQVEPPELSNSFACLAEMVEDTLPEEEVCEACEVEASHEPYVARRKRRRRFGALESHVRYLQYTFRRSRSVRPGCWSRGGMVGLCWYRPRERWACDGGLNLASEERIGVQVARSRAVLDWYGNYVLLLRRLSSGKRPTALVTYCGQGGVSEGVRRAHGGCHGQDLRPQPRYTARYGDRSFTEGDSSDAFSVRDLRRRCGAFVTIASPPCKPYSTALLRGEASEPALIEQTRDALRSAGGLYVIENVPGARADMRNGACILHGTYFGLHVDRPRFFESNFRIHVDKALKEGGERLKGGMCLGIRRRWRRLDPFGRPSRHDCCGGNLWAVQGDKPLRCTTSECAWAMGLDTDHMDYAGMSQAVPPAYSELVFSQACMREVETRFGIRAVTFDEFESNPDRYRALMHHWLRGAGGSSPGQGTFFEKARAEPSATREASTSDNQCLAHDEEEREGHAPQYRAIHGDSSGDVVAPAIVGTVFAAELREVEYSWAGGFDCIMGGGDVWQALSPVRPSRRLSPGCADSELGGVNSLLCLNARDFADRVPRIAALVKAHPGTRVTVEARGGVAESLLRGLGFRLVRRVHRGKPAYSSEGRNALLPIPRSYWSIGRVKLSDGEHVVYGRLAEHMDPLDRPGAAQEPKTAKAARSYVPIPWEPSRWDIGLPPELDRMMAREGVGIHPVEEVTPTEVPFYKWASNEGLLKSIAEADRALISGAMEYVPASRVGEVFEKSTIHPWTIVDQGGGKWRLCHDYSVGTNRRVPTASFSLPSVWDVVPVIRPGSHFAKYDIRDGFWHVPIAEDSRCRLVVRHPGTGRLIWASRLPFGYLDSPRLFCGLTEAIIARVRRRAAGKGIHYYVFVDDVLCVGDDEELTREGMRLLEEEFLERGVQWAPNKTRGPCKCIEFLGLLLCNTPDTRGVTITEKRRRKLRESLASWLERRPESGTLEVDPREMASFLGKLVFAAQVVKGGRTYMQGMLSQFKGLVVDWRRGSVLPHDGKWRPMRVVEGFWRDLEWWVDHLDSRSLASFDRGAPSPECVLSGTDASGWGTGQVVWLDGSREESHLRFTHAEQRRPINWRELLGIVRLLEVWGGRFAGRTVVVETDNMAARGATAKLRSKSEDMQELVRRILRAAEIHGFTVRVTHTPGESLDRPDQTSRGDDVEEPRFRLREDLYRRLEGRWGPFTDLIGAEREYGPRGKSEAGKGRSLWLHPTSGTVGSALRRMHAELATDLVGNRAVAVVPDDDAPAWNKLMRHGLTIGRLETGDPALEMNELGRWRPVDTRRPARVVLFPRAAGAWPRRVQLAFRESLELQTPSGTGRMTAAGAGYFMLEDGASFRLHLFPGAFVYSLPKEGGFGGFYMVADRPSLSAEGEPDDFFCRYIELDSSKAARRLKSGAGDVFTMNTKARLHRPDPLDLWTVDHCVTWLSASNNGHTVKFSFDWTRANEEIRRAGGAWRDATNGWDMLSDASGGTPTAQGDGAGGRGGPSRAPPASCGSVASGYSPFQEMSAGSPRCEPSFGVSCESVASSAAEGTCGFAGCEQVVWPGHPYCGFGHAAAQAALEARSSGDTSAEQPAEGTCKLAGCKLPVWPGHPFCGRTHAAASELREAELSVYLGRPVGELEGADEACLSCEEPYGGATDGADRLAAVIQNLDRLHLQQSAVKTGSEGRVEQRDTRVRGGGVAGEAGRVQQPCQYADTPCLGCGEPFVLGEMMLSYGTGFIHPGRAACQDLADAIMQSQGEADGERTTGRFFALFSLATGVSGVYTDWGEVVALRSAAEEGDMVQCEECPTFFAAQDWVKEATSAAASEDVVPRGIRGSLIKRAHLAEKLSDARLAMIANCVEGSCQHARNASNLTMCRGGCGRSLHMMECAQLGRGMAALGNFKCVECRLVDMMENPEMADDRARSLAMRTCVLELGQGKETTAATFADYVTLEERYALGPGTVLDGGQLRLPRHNVEACKNFITWVSLDAERVRSLEGIKRTAGLFFAKLSIPNMFARPDVKAHIKEVIGECAMEHEPATACTPLMLKIAVEEVIPEKYTNPFICSRELVQFDCEGVGGCRIGEVAGGGDSHGLLANDVSILEDPTVPRGELRSVVVEAHLAHSKTGYSRYLDMAGKTQTSGIEVAKHMRTYWQRAGFKVDTFIQAGVRVTRPDFWVLRVSLRGLDAIRLDSLCVLIMQSKLSAVARGAKTTCAYAKRRWLADGAQAQQKKYVNVAGGPAASQDMEAFKKLLEEYHFDVSKVPGPLLLATTGGSNPAITCMPLATGSAFKPTKEILEEACRRANLKGKDPDLDVGPGEEPKWTTHSLRRGADTVARRYREAMGVTEAMIDIYFGWQERILKRAMQVHYAAMSIRERMATAIITGMM